MIDFRSYQEFKNHEMLIAFTDEVSGLKGYIGIHSTKLGIALGGTRFQTYGSDELAMRDALRLSQAMSYKCALANLPYGGGKGVIIASSEKARNQVLTSYARAVDNLRGLFKTGTDVGVSDEDVKLMGQTTSHMLGLTEGDRHDLSTASCAALGVFCAMKAALSQLNNSEDFHGRTVAIKGVGKLGGELARLISQAGGRLVVADVDEQRAQAIASEVGGTVVPVAEIHTQEVDIYAPCALGSEFTSKSITDLRCRTVVGGANNQLDSQEIGDHIFERDILYVPDYVANAGGLIYVADELEPGGFTRDRVLQRVHAIQQTVADILNRAAQSHQPTSTIADMIAEERIQEGLSHG